MKQNLLHQPLFRIVFPPIYGVMMYFLILLINNSLDQLADTVFTNELLICAVLAYLISEGTRLVIISFKRLSGSNFGKTGSLLFLFPTTLITSVLLTLLAGYLYFTYYEQFEYYSSYAVILHKLMIIYGISGMLYTMFFMSIFFLSVKNEGELKKEDLKRQNLEHQLEIFNNEINPDLLFQSLETLISLVHHNLDIAEDFVDRLALVYRYILDNRKKELVSVEEELKAAKNLIYLFKEKFPDQIDFRIKNELCGKSSMLVPNTIPMILDCMINGSIISAWQPLEISIDCADDDDYLVIQHKENDKLSNNKYIKNRYQNVHEAFSYFTDRPVIQIKAYGDVFIKLPLLNVKEGI